MKQPPLYYQSASYITQTLLYHPIRYKRRETGVSFWVLQQMPEDCTIRRQVKPGDRRIIECRTPSTTPVVSFVIAEAQTSLAHEIRFRLHKIVTQL
ncbi:hypothetical protein CEXT_324841 [Caerostris extrusa]|uniref:Uncharacterized protein n=1 Tax=Caerostris extrusa TaxID=172846 RepID=A0AAV4TTT2_CAEEX|nr:hypothetical protein CEXT_324841 [Caerostris extrusa]